MNRHAAFIVTTALALLLTACESNSFDATMDGITTSSIESSSPDENVNTSSPDSSLLALDASLDLEGAESLISDYFNTLRNGFRYVQEYLYYGEYESIREEVANFPDKLVDFVIEDSQKINDNLYEFTMLTEFDLFQPGVYVRDFTFVGYINGRAYVITSADFIPDELCENLDTEKYIQYYSNTNTDDSRPREANGKPIVQPGDPEYGLIIDEGDLLINQD